MPLDAFGIHVGLEPHEGDPRDPEIVHLAVVKECKAVEAVHGQVVSQLLLFEVDDVGHQALSRSRKILGQL